MVKPLPIISPPKNYFRKKTLPHPPHCDHRGAIEAVGETTVGATVVVATLAVVEVGKAEIKDISPAKTSNLVEDIVM